MKKTKSFWRQNAKFLIFGAAAIFAVLFLLLYKLGSLAGGLSATEISTATNPLGWNGIFQNPLNLPINFARSVVYFIAPDHGLTLTRLPSIMFGFMAVISFSILIWLWHGTRTALLSGAMFATSAWVLHVSRFAGFDVLYLWAIPSLLLIQVLIHRYGDKSYIWYGSLMLWGLLLYIPGMVWLILIQIACQRKLLLKTAAGYSTLKARALSALAIFIWLPLLGIGLLRDGQFSTWIGLPNHFGTIIHTAKEFAAVPVHIFFRGPQNPELWLDRVPIFDIFTLVVCIIGIYFYARNWNATRSQTLGFLFLGSIALVGLGGAFSLSSLVALMYVFAAAGIAYLLHEWLKVFPLNPLARSAGILLVSIAVALSCLYGIRSYFIAWPHNNITRVTFHYHR